ncbi:MBL fold metallo-hydrolase [Alkalibacillus silvisoli]|uniref:MBL fold metallo-hydrolase n=1 Tax=Alkalibacillus silvisoli TaxID=392823 RepID=A0ABN0ZQ10_9BACI
MRLTDPWFTVQTIHKKTYAISEYGHWEKVHSFLLLGDNEAVLIDTGLGIDDLKRVTNQLTDLPIKVVTTHVHWDHIGSHGSYQDLLVHELEEDWLVNGIKGLPIEQIRYDIARDLTKEPPSSFDPSTYKPFQGKPSQLLHDGDVIDLGGRSLTIYHTPGHSPGHICISDQLTGFLFTGDLLYQGAPVYAFFKTTNPSDLVNSLEKIANIPNVTQVFGSHNQLGMNANILKEVSEASSYLKINELDRHGTGLHQFTNFSVKF